MLWRDTFVVDADPLNRDDETGEGEDCGAVRQLDFDLAAGAIGNPFHLGPADVAAHDIVVVDEGYLLADPEFRFAEKLARGPPDSVLR